MTTVLDPGDAIVPDYSRKLKENEMTDDTANRRCDVTRMTLVEKAISGTIREVEDLGAHTLLTDAVVLLAQARDKVADYVELSENNEHLQKPR